MLIISTAWQCVRDYHSKTSNGTIEKLMKKILKYGDEDDVGYILEVDLEYPKDLHDLHNDYPLAPEIMSINENMLSDVQ